jgi:hypothetical protein
MTLEFPVYSLVQRSAVYVLAGLLLLSGARPSIGCEDEAKVVPPPLTQGMPYSTARQQVLKAGWRPHLQGDAPNLNSSIVKALFDQGYVEIKDCAGTGEGPCLLEFVNAQGEVLAITTVSGGRQAGDRVVRGWRVELPAKPAPSAAPKQIAPGRYWVGNTDQALEVERQRYRYETELGAEPWQPIARLKPVRYGVVVDENQTYWCLSSLAPKNRAIACSANGWVTAQTQENSPTPLPFVGTRRFNFLGGSGTGQSITIASDGHTIVQLHGTIGSSVQYSGPFTNPIVLQSGQRLLIQDNQVYSVAADNDPNTCAASDPDAAPCVTSLY